jgi:transcriptional regulator with XRE-family HTH domain
MLTPGQLIRQQRHDRGLTQFALASRASISRSMLTRYESDRCFPTWPVLCRIMAAMGMQPGVVAEECDVSLHAATATRRRSFNDAAWARTGVWRRDEEPVDLCRVIRPDIRTESLIVPVLQPIAAFLDGLSYVITGRASLRLQGVCCSVPSVSVLLHESSGMDVVRAPPDESVPESADDPRELLWRLLADRCAATSMHLWSESLACYQRSPNRFDLAGAAREGTGELCLRTRDTATQLRVTITSEQLPPHVSATVEGMTLTVLALSQYRPGNR